MTHEDALFEAHRRWVPGKRNHRMPVADVKLGRYRVGFDDGEFIYVMGASTEGWKQAFEHADERAKKVRLQ